MRVFAFVFIFCFTLFANEKTYGTAICDLVSVYDGDTLTCNIKEFPPVAGEKIGVRVYGIDTPELKTKNAAEKALGLQAKEVAENALKTAKVIELRNMRRDKYFRILAEVYVDGKELAEILIEKKLARRYYGGKKEAW